tara:strand:- start:141 stop:374 length:234 start_codon:yes stop_codon:yes gene_type:complete
MSQKFSAIHPNLDTPYREREIKMNDNNEHPPSKRTDTDKKKPGEVCVRWVDFSRQGKARERRWRYAKPLKSDQKRAA